MKPENQTACTCWKNIDRGRLRIDHDRLGLLLAHVPNPVGVEFRIPGLLFQVVKLADEIDDVLRCPPSAFFRAGLDYVHEFPAHVGQAGIFGEDVANDLDLGRDEVEFLTAFLADAGVLAAASADFVRFGDVMDDLDAGKFLRNGTATGFLAGVGGDGDLGCLELSPGHRLGLVEEGTLPLQSLKRSI